MSSGMRGAGESGVAVFSEPGPLGLQLTEAFHRGTGELYIHVASVRAGSQADAVPELRQGGLQLLSVGGLAVAGSTYDQVVEGLAQRPVELVFGQPLQGGVCTRERCLLCPCGCLGSFLGA
jgi:hypothetical protein